MTRFFTLDRLYLATVLAGHWLLAVWSLVSENPIANLVQEILPFVQFTLLILWVLVGPGHWRIRLPGLPVVAGCLWGWSHFARYWPGQEMLPLGLWVIAAAMVFGIGLRLTRLRVLRPTPVSIDANRPLQFSIRSLLITTTVCCLLVMCGKWVHATVILSGGDRAYPYVELLPHLARGTLAAGLVAISLLSLVGVLGMRHPWLFSLLVIPLAAGIGAVLALVLHQQADWVSLSFWIAAQGLLVAGTLAPIRNMGYRFRRAERQSSKVRRASAECTVSFQVNHEPVSAAP